MNNYTLVCTETFQKFSRKSKNYNNTERKGAASSNKKEFYKAQRDAKRMNWEMN